MNEHEERLVAAATELDVPDEERWLALWDIDGTLADDTHRVHFAIARQWFSYFDAKRMADDSPFSVPISVVQIMDSMGWEIAYLTGRRTDRRQVTQEWLERHQAPNPFSLMMRGFADSMPLAEFKVQQIRRVLASGQWDRVVLFDDDPEVVRLVQKNFGQEVAFHCTWHTKPKELVKAAKG